MKKPMLAVSRIRVLERSLDLVSGGDGPMQHGAGSDWNIVAPGEVAREALQPVTLAEDGAL